MVAANGLLTVVLRLVQLPKLLPQPGLGRLSEQCLHTAMQGFQLPMEGSRGGGPTEQKGLWGLGVTLGGTLPRPQTYLPSPAPLNPYSPWSIIRFVRVPRATAM